ncbi:murein biosynthesis integral membrane protein MurJ [Desulfobacula sp.]|uniref:murein biosynthesis integral membrane protein MurJ n=1 Tax=Desulfobacula sp. TaxID=2593537 RepID=UPI0026045BFB|nr:murein biosynthesis integral membrane protein MurJ [Desulfobacula sp.]
MRKIFKKTALLSGLTFFSRVLGVVRDALIAMCFGTSSQSDAFFVAFRPFDLVRKLFSEGILSMSFVPVFSETMERKGKSRAVALGFSFFCFLSLAGVLVVLAGIVFAPLVIKIIAPGFRADPVQYDLTILLLKLMLPYFWLVLITALCMGVLNAVGNFGVPASAPIVFNLVVIVFTLLVDHYFKIPVMGLAVGVTIGGVLQLAIQIPFMIRLGMLNPAFFSFFQPEMVTVLRTMIPCMIGAASYQVNIMVASFFASTLDDGSVSFLYYADRLVQFPMALFAVSAATVFLPALSRKAVKGQLDDIAVLFSNGVKLVLFITIPAMAGLMALGENIVAVLFGHGAFNDLAVQQTADSLFFLVSGLWAFTGVRLFVTLYYALSCIKIPFYSGILAMGMNLVLCPLLVDCLGLRGLALSVSLSAMAGFVFLFVNIPGIVRIDKTQIIVSACRSVFLSAIMFIFVRQAAGLIVMEKANGFWFGAGVIGCIGFGMVVYWSVNCLVSSPELKMLKQGIGRE